MAVALPATQIPARPSHKAPRATSRGAFDETAGVRGRLPHMPEYRPSRLFTPALLLVALLLASLGPAHALPAREWVAAPGTNERLEAVAGEVLVLWSPATSRSSREQAHRALGAQVLARTPLSDIEKVRLPAGMSVPQALAHYQANPHVRAAEPNYLSRLNLVPDDPLLTYQQYLPQIQAPQAWDVATGSASVVVAVIDSGVDLSHPDLQGKLWTNPGEIPSNGINDDGNGITDDRPLGYVDDCYGWDFVNNDPDPSPNPDGKDNDGIGGPDTGVPHGTMVAGIIGATTNNSVGIASLGWNVKIMALQTHDDEGYADYFAIGEAIDYAVAMGAQVINLSTSGPYSSLMQTSIDTAYSHNCVVVAAAGNADPGLDLDTHPQSPVCNDEAGNHVVGVAAVDSQDVCPSWSNHGSQYVDVSAPGVAILSTSYLNPTYNFTNAYVYGNGTSFAAPLVSALAALVKSVRPAASPAEVMQVLKQGAVNIDAKNPGLAGELGAGRIDAWATVAQAQGFAFPAGLSLISFGLNLAPATDTPSEIFGPTPVTLYAWDPTLSPPDYLTYSDPRAQWFQPAAGYWLRADASGVARLEGTVLPQDQPAEIAVRTGWNLIGSPFALPVPWDPAAIQVRTATSKTLAAAAAAGEVHDYAWAYDQQQGYLPVTSLALGGALNQLEFHRGYWFYAAQDATLVLPAPAAGVAGLSRAASQMPAWSLALVAATDVGRATVVIGSAQPGQPEVRFLAPPAAEGQPAIRLLAFGTPVQQRPLAPSAVHLPALGMPTQPAAWDLGVYAPAGDEVRLSWPGIVALPRSLEASLQDLETGASVSLRNATTYSFNADAAPRRLRLTVTPSVGGLLLQLPPPQRARSGAYEFTIVSSAACRLSLEVLTLAGEVVAHPCTDTAAVAGVNRRVWLPRGSTGSVLPPGPYLCRAQAISPSGQAANAVRVFRVE